MSLRTVLIVFAAAYVILSRSRCVEATLPWFTDTSPHELQLPIPEICGLRVVIANRTYNSSVLYDLPPNVGPVEYVLLQENFTLDDVPKSPAVSPGSDVPGSFGQWLVRIGPNAAGALISPKHVITLAPCLADYRTWYSGYSSFAVRISDQLIPVEEVKVQPEAGDGFPLALLTLGRHNLTRVSPPVCVGAYRPGLVARGIAWSEVEDVPQEHAVTVYPDWHCAWYVDDFQGRNMFCGSPGPGMCGSSLAQIEDGRWRLSGFHTGKPGSVSTYIDLGKSRQWLKQLFMG